jgi:tetratricopeptide (TPR) repeat protein
MAELSSYQETEQLLEQSLALYRALGDHWPMANVLHELSWSAERRGAFSQAQTLCQESLAIYRAQGDPRGTAGSLRFLGLLSWGHGQLEDANRLSRESLDICQEIGDRDMIALGLQHLGQTLVQCGQFAEGYQLLLESMDTYADLGRRRALAWVNPALAFSEVHLGRYEKAHAHAQLGLKLAQESAEPWSIGICHSALGVVALASPAYGQAQQSLLEGVSAFRQIGHQPSLSWYIAILALASRGLGQRAQAHQHVAEAMHMAIEMGAFFPLVNSLVALALLQLDQGKPEQGLELYSLASRTPYVANSHWFQAVAGRHIAEAAASLPPPAAEAARARGLALDLWQTAAHLLAELPDPA